jgi:hypothetical protein
VPFNLNGKCFLLIGCKCADDLASPPIVVSKLTMQKMSGTSARNLTSSIAAHCSLASRTPHLSSGKPSSRSPQAAISNFKVAPCHCSMLANPPLSQACTSGVSLCLLVRSSLDAHSTTHSITRSGWKKLASRMLWKRDSSGQLAPRQRESITRQSLHTFRQTY